MIRRPVPSLLAAGVPLALGLALLAGACGTPSATPDVASVAAPAEAETADAPTTTGPARDPKEAALEFARCMREHGVEMPDPEISEDGGVGINLGGDASTLDTGALEAAQEACQPALDAAVQQGDRKIDPAEEARMRENALKFSQCMREHGIDMPDPEFGDNGKVTQRLAGPDRGGPDPESPAFQQAQEECGKLLDGPGMIVRGKRAPGNDAEGGK